MKVADGAWKRARVVQIEGRAWAPSPGRGAVAAPARPAPRRDPRTESRTRLVRREPSQNRVLGVHRERARAHAPARARAHVRSRERDFFPRPDEKQQRRQRVDPAAPRFQKHESGSTRGGREKKKKALRRCENSVRLLSAPEVSTVRSSRPAMSVGLNRAELFVTQNSMV